MAICKITIFKGIITIIVAFFYLLKISGCKRTTVVPGFVQNFSRLQTGSCTQKVWETQFEIFLTIGELVTLYSHLESVGFISCLFVYLVYLSNYISFFLF